MFDLQVFGIAAHAVLVFCLLGTTISEAASLIRMQPEYHGSVDPEGDILNVTLLFSPQQQSVDVEVRAFEIHRPAGDDVDTTVTPIAGRGDEYRDQNGSFLLKRTLEAPKNELLSRVQLVIPYSALELAVGRHQIGYELVVVDGDSEDAAATRANSIEVFAEPREITFFTFKTTKISQKRKKPVFLIQDGEVVQSETVEEKDGAHIVPVFRRLTTRYRGNTGPLDAMPGSDIATGPLWTLNALTADGRMFSGMPTKAKSGNHIAMYLQGVRKQFNLKSIEEMTLSNQTPVIAEPQTPEIGASLRTRAWIPKPKIAIHFATNRNVVNDRSSKPDRFGDEMGDLSYGECQVSIPLAVHRRGRLERPRWWQSEDPNQHWITKEIRPLTSNVFYDRVKNVLTNQDDDDVLVYIHGFNNTYESCVLTAARLKHDTEFTGLVIAFSWPSEGRRWDWTNLEGPYRRDEAKVAKSADSLELVFRELIKQRGDKGLGKIHVLAHSMGNQVLMKALRKIGGPPQPTDPHFGHVIFAAPDSDVRSFVQDFDICRYYADDYTLYFCEDDVALQTSRRINSDSRVGQLHLLIDRLDNIDCTNANTSWIGHGYIVDRDILLVDLQMLLMMDRRPSDRCPPLRHKPVLQRKAWYFP